MIEIKQINEGALFSRSNKVRRVVRIFKEYSSAYGEEISVVETEWVVGKLKGKRNILWLGQLCAWAEFEIDETKLRAYEEAISEAL